VYGLRKDVKRFLTGIIESIKNLCGSKDIWLARGVLDHVRVLMTRWSSRAVWNLLYSLVY